MGDLQCPATVIFVADAATADSLPTLRFRVAQVLSPDVCTPVDLVGAVKSIVDEYRGECVAVVAPRPLVSKALAEASAHGSTPPAIAAPWVAVEVDSSGWKLLPTNW
ncbi:hypothetical protein IEE91_12870 [Kocuria sp. cx-455]|uniref:hypothetical protein n=1 Tax=Kocuria sp. cx-455 TaxID=2771377 RepID=UPI001686B2AD|nr:hypothetical protein [Kocuria sp. cx-455]MBD2766066.1 hypothetical protein [Kocuria sp. cx-455]